MGSLNSKKYQITPQCKKQYKKYCEIIKSANIRKKYNIKLYTLKINL